MDPNPQPHASESSNAAQKNISAWPGDFDPALETWKAYIRTLQKLKEYCPPEYAKVPEILKGYGANEIDALTAYDIQSLQAAKALPSGPPRTASEEELKTIRNYILTLHRMKGTSPYAEVPPVLRNMSDDEIENLNQEYLEAFRLMNVLPDSLLPQAPDEDTLDMRKLDAALAQFCASDPELQQIVANPARLKELGGHPKMIAFLNSRPDLKRTFDKATAKIVKQFTATPLFPQTPDAPEVAPYKGRPYGSADPSEDPTRQVAKPLLEQIAQMARGTGLFGSF